MNRVDSVQTDKPRARCEKLGVVIYLRNVSPSLLADFVSDFHERWQGAALVNTGGNGDCSHFAAGRSGFTVDVRHARVRDSLTDAIMDNCFWARAEDLAPHAAHIVVAAPPAYDDPFALASDLTRVVVSLLKVSDSLGVSWLNGPTFFKADEFVNIAVQIFGSNELPFMLWISPHWNPEGRLLYTKGMSQFGAQEIFIGEQYERSLEMTEYLFGLVNYCLTSGNVLLEGETIDGPACTFKIEFLHGRETGKEGVLLLPVRPN